MFLGLPDPDPLLFVQSTDPDPAPSLNKHKNLGKILFLQFCDFFNNLISLKNDENVPMVRNKQKNQNRSNHAKKRILCRYLDPDQDPNS
jgi:hypothetical protein